VRGQTEGVIALGNTVIEYLVNVDGDAELVAELGEEAVGA
jgi:hypothetical protein